MAPWPDRCSVQTRAWAQIYSQLEVFKVGLVQKVQNKNGCLLAKPGIVQARFQRKCPLRGLSRRIPQPGSQSSRKHLFGPDAGVCFFSDQCCNELSSEWELAFEHRFTSAKQGCRANLSYRCIFHEQLPHHSVPDSFLTASFLVSLWT